MAGTNLTEYLASEDWMEDAECIGTDNKLFFPEEKGKAVWKIERIAKSICADCTVRLDCLEFALRTNEKHGIWGGLSPRERNKIRRRPR